MTHRVTFKPDGARHWTAHTDSERVGHGEQPRNALDDLVDKMIEAGEAGSISEFKYAPQPWRI